MKPTLALLILCLAASAHAQVYKCIGADGKVIYGDKVCAGSGKTLTIYNAPTKGELREQQSSRYRAQEMREYARPVQQPLMQQQQQVIVQNNAPAPTEPAYDHMSSTQAIERERQRKHEIAVARASRPDAPVIINNTPTSAPRTVFCDKGYCW